MNRIKELTRKVKALYEAKDPNRADWADWLAENHVFVVADYAEKLADRYGANKELAMAAATLHDVADAVMSRESPEHGEKSLEMARTLLNETGFSEEEISLIVDDAIHFHGCHGEDAPRSLEGKIMAAADGLAHIRTDFYDYALEVLQKTESLEEIKDWALPKIERDYRKKIYLPELREETAADYERVKVLFA